MYYIIYLSLDDQSRCRYINMCDVVLLFFCNQQTRSNWRASEASETLFSHVYGSSRYIYIYVRLFLICMCALSVVRIKFKS